MALKLLVPLRILLRLLWRNRSRLSAQGVNFEGELATTVRSVLVQRGLGRRALGGYRLAMNGLKYGSYALLVVAVIMAILLWRITPILAVVALLPLALGVAFWWWRSTWGAPLEWMDQNADRNEVVRLRDIPGRLRSLASRARSAPEVPNRIADQLEKVAERTEEDVAKRGEHPTPVGAGAPDRST